MTEHTLLVLSNLEIVPLDTTDFVGFVELQGQLPKSGWLGLVGEQAILSFDASSISAGGIEVGTVELSSDRLLDDVPVGGWFRRWRIVARIADEVQVIFEMK